MSDPLRLCKNPACERAVRAGAFGHRQTDYCCAPCAEAGERGYEIHAHSEGCDERWQERRHIEIRYGR